MLANVLQELQESATFADLLWSFHRAEKGCDLAVIEDHITTLCGRMYLAGVLSGVTA